MEVNRSIASEYCVLAKPRRCLVCAARAVAKLYASRALIQGAIDRLVKRAIKSRHIRRDLDPFDLLRALIGLSNVASSPDWQQSAKRLVEILITGSRPVK